MTDTYRPGIGDTVLIGPSCGLDEPDVLLVVTAVRDIEDRDGWVELDGRDEYGRRRTGLEVEAARVYLWHGGESAVGKIVAGSAPRSGQTVRAIIVGGQPIWLELTADAVPSPIDDADGRDIHNADWLTLTGWELDEDGQRLLRRTKLPVRRLSISVEVRKDGPP